ncbi:aminotransferase class V-fold PLP-dependent enzyme [Actinomadura citrea]|uniref:aminotransferase class V-fold PLP-dependent enzyme n=1 Tax=Actinomadura citrea TaxID=46158 RepID=UPI003B845B0C
MGASASQVLAPVAASLPPGSRVVVPDIEQTSNLFPWLVQDLDVRTVPPADLPGAIDERTDAVAFSLVQSATGEAAAVDEVVAAARAHGALVRRRRHPGGRPAPGRRDAFRRPRRLGLQVADVPARYRLLRPASGHPSARAWRAWPSTSTRPRPTSTPPSRPWSELGVQRPVGRASPKPPTRRFTRLGRGPS